MKNEEERRPLYHIIAESIMYQYGNSVAANS
jgi:hypothetical protein